MTKSFYDLVPSAPEGRYDGIDRPYSVEEVERLRGSFPIEYTLATRGSNRLWDLLHSEDQVSSLGALSGNQAMQMVKAGLKAIYLSGWQVAADNNTAGSTYPDQSLYPANSGPELARKKLTELYKELIKLSILKAAPRENGLRQLLQMLKRVLVVH